MGRMNDADNSEFFKFEATPYYMEVYHDKVNGLNERDKMSILNTLKRYQKQYPFSSFLYAESTTGKIKYRKKYKTRKPGRPKEKPIGKKVLPHVHIILVGNAEQSVWTCGKKIEAAIDKRLRKSGLKGKRAKLQNYTSEQHAVNDIVYVMRQADLVNTKGDFDFYKFDQIETRNYFGTFASGR